MYYTVEGILGSIVARVDSTDKAISTVLNQMTLSDKALSKLKNKLERATPGSRVLVDHGGVGCTVTVSNC